MNYMNLTKLAERGFSLYMEEHRYGCKILAGIDFPLLSLDNYSYFGRESVFDYVDAANSPGDDCAMEAYNKLYDFAQEHEAFLFVAEKTIEDCLLELDRRAALWLNLDGEQRDELLNKFIAYQGSPII